MSDRQLVNDFPGLDGTEQDHWVKYNLGAYKARGVDYTLKVKTKCRIVHLIEAAMFRVEIFQHDTFVVHKAAVDCMDSLKALRNEDHLIVPVLFENIERRTRAVREAEGELGEVYPDHEVVLYIYKDMNGSRNLVIFDTLRMVDQKTYPYECDREIAICEEELGKAMDITGTVRYQAYRSAGVTNFPCAVGSMRTMEYIVKNGTPGVGYTPWKPFVGGAAGWIRAWNQIKNLKPKRKELPCRFKRPKVGLSRIINKSLNQGLQVPHALTMSSITPSGYRFGSTYIGSQIIPPSDLALVLFGDTDPSGNVNAQGFYSWNDYIKTKFAAQVMNSKFAAIKMGMDVRSKDFTSLMTFVNLNLFNEMGIGVFHFLQQVTPKLCLGAEFMYQRALLIPGGDATVLTCSGRFTTDDSIWSGFAGTNNIGLSYYRRLNEEIEVGLELDNSYQQQQFIAALVYQFDLPKANFSMKAMVDNNWTVTGCSRSACCPCPSSSAYAAPSITSRISSGSAVDSPFNI